MLDLPRLQRIRLTARPRVQRVVAYGLLMPNYDVPPRVRISLEGTVPEEPVIFAMNHTDRYNYWPFQYRLFRDHDRFTATWVKGKYYESRFVGKFMELTNNIPTVSRGYLITRDFLSVMGRHPTDAEYSALRRAVDAVALGCPNQVCPVDAPDRVWSEPRDMLGRAFDPKREDYPVAVDALFRAMMRRFVELNGEAFDRGLDLLVFPEGTRSRQLARGHIGLAEIALHFRRTIVPVGCSGSDLVYPGGFPIGRAGRITYRIGRPIPYEETAPYHVPGDFEPFSPEAEESHRHRFQGLVDLVMQRINDLVEPPYQRIDGESSGVQGTRRFV